MKKGIHPKYKEMTITCGGCGNVIRTRSTKDSYRVDVCSNCHPFYTGRQKYVDSAGRVERFQRKWGASIGASPEGGKKGKKAEKPEAAPVAETASAALAAPADPAAAPAVQAQAPVPAPVATEAKEAAPQSPPSPQNN